MKKLIVIAFVGLLSFHVNAQKNAEKELICKSYKDAIDKNVKLTENPKQNAKSATWVKLAESYIEHALQCGTDSTASLKAYQTFLKAQEVEDLADIRITEIREVQKSSERRLAAALESLRQAQASADRAQSQLFEVSSQAESRISGLQAENAILAEGMPLMAISILSAVSIEAGSLRSKEPYSMLADFSSFLRRSIT